MRNSSYWKSQGLRFNWFGEISTRFLGMKFLSSGSWPSLEGLCEDSSPLRVSPLGTQQGCASWQLPPGISSFPVPNGLHDEQDPSAALAPGPLRSGEWTDAPRVWAIFGSSVLHLCDIHINTKTENWVCSFWRSTLFSKSSIFLALTLLCTFKNLTFFDGLFHFQILAGPSLRYARSMISHSPDRNRSRKQAAPYKRSCLLWILL